MAKIIDSRDALDDTVKIFDDFYNFNVTVNGNEYDAVYSFFKKVTNNSNIADNYTAYLFRISFLTNISVMDFLQKLNAFSKIEINKYMAYYLNSFKSKTTLYGVSQLLQPNMVVARNIIQ
jgi:hypothetical protein